MIKQTGVNAYLPLWGMTDKITIVWTNWPYLGRNMAILPNHVKVTLGKATFIIPKLNHGSFPKKQRNTERRGENNQKKIPNNDGVRQRKKSENKNKKQQHITAVYLSQG